MAARTNGVIIVRDENAKKFYLKYADRLGMKIRPPIIAGGFLSDEKEQSKEV